MNSARSGSSGGIDPALVPLPRPRRAHQLALHLSFVPWLVAGIAGGWAVHGAVGAVVGGISAVVSVAFVSWRAYRGARVRSATVDFPRPDINAIVRRNRRVTIAIPLVWFAAFGVFIGLVYLGVPFWLNVLLFTFGVPIGLVFWGEHDAQAMRGATNEDRNALADLQNRWWARYGPWVAAVLPAYLLVSVVVFLIFR